jgi:hypothetical protein
LDQNRQNPSSNGLPVCVAIQQYMLSDIQEFDKFAKKTGNKQLMDMLAQLQMFTQDYKQNLDLL